MVHCDLQPLTPISPFHLPSAPGSPDYQLSLWLWTVPVTSSASVFLHSVQSLRRVWLFVTPWTTARQAFLPITNSWSPPKPVSIESVMPSSHLILCRPLLLLPSIKWVSSSHQVAKVLEFQLQHQSFQWTPRTDDLEDGMVGSPCSPRDSQESSPTPHFKSINSSVLSLLYSPTLTSIHDYWKNHSLTRWTFVDKVMSLLFNMLSKLVITFPQRSKCLLISWLQSPSAFWRPEK